MKHKIKFTLNGSPEELEVESHQTLLDVLRDELGITSPKRGCETGECGACTVLLDGKAVNSCLVLAPEVEGCTVTTVEGLSSDGKLDSLQKAFIEYSGVQCGFCTPGMIMTAKELLTENNNPTSSEIRERISGNLCRCGIYNSIIEAIGKAAENS